MPSCFVLRSARKARLVLGAWIASLAIVRPAGGQLPAISNGIAALARHDIAAASREFERVAAGECCGRNGSLAQRVAERWLAHIAWLTRGDTLAARTHLERALTGSSDSAAALVEQARLLAFEL